MVSTCLIVSCQLEMHGKADSLWIGGQTHSASSSTTLTRRSELRLLYFTELSRGLRHQQAGVLAYRLLTIHNLSVYLKLIEEIRGALSAGTFTPSIKNTSVVLTER